MIGRPKRALRTTALFLIVASLAVYFYLRGVRGIAGDARPQEQYLVVMEYSSQAIFAISIAVAFVEDRRWKKHCAESARLNTTKHN
jgi:hypothetical protein